LFAGILGGRSILLKRLLFPAGRLFSAATHKTNPDTNMNRRQFIQTTSLGASAALAAPATVQAAAAPASPP
jgi:hypothetical protein